MQVQRRMTEIRSAGASVYSTQGAGKLVTEGVSLGPGDVGEVSEEIALAFQHKLCKPGSQVEGEPVKAIGECVLDFDAPQSKKPKPAKATRSKGPADGEGDDSA